MIALQDLQPSVRYSLFSTNPIFNMFFQSGGGGDSTIQYNTIQYNTIQYNTIQYNTIQYNTIQYNTIQLLSQKRNSCAGFIKIHK